MTIECSNPYPGPESFARGDARPYFGRDQETSDVTSLAVTERLLVFYAPSGAGKTSLLNKRVIPRLEEKLYEVLPTARVSGAASLPAGVRNAYAYNLMLRLAPNDPQPERFAQLSLSDFLWRLSTEDGKKYHYDPSDQALRVATSQRDLWPRVLVLDQFEEIVTSYPTYWSHREDFFRQLDDALSSDGMLRVIMSLRSDYVQDLERYAGLMQHGLRARYQMFLMSVDDAHLAIEGPAAACGRTFEPGVAQQLVRNMSQVREPDVDGKIRTVPGEAVEPIQLQVVCYQLWESMKQAPGDKIEMKDLQRLARATLAARPDSDQLSQRQKYELLSAFVDGALGAFYETALGKARSSAAAHVDEAFLRNWFSTQLITESGTRGFMQRGHDDSGGVPEEVVQKLVDHHLLRSDTRGSVRLVELIHDRFVEPIRAANLQWNGRRRRELPWIDAAYRWRESGASPETRTAALLLADLNLKTVLHDTAGQQFEPIVAEYLAASKEAQEKREEKAERDALRSKAEQEKERADLQAQAAEALALKAEAERERADVQAAAAKKLRRRGFWLLGLAGVVFALLLAVGILALDLNDQTETVKSQLVKLKEINQALTTTNKTLDDTNAALEISRTTLSALNVALKEESRESRSLILANQSRYPSLPEDRLLLARAAISSANTLAANGALLEALDAAYRTDQAIAPYVPSETFGAVSDAYPTGIAASRDGRLLAIADELGRITLWDNAADARIGEPFNVSPRGAITGLAFDAAGRRLATVTGDRYDPASDYELILWNLADPAEPVRTVVASRQPSMLAVDLSPDGNLMAVAFVDGRVALWDLSETQPVSRTLPGWDAGAPLSVAFDAAGQRLAAGGEDGVIVLWDNLTRVRPTARRLEGHNSAVNDIDFSSDGATLISASDDGAVGVWRRTGQSWDSQDISPPSASGWQAQRVAISPDDQRVAVLWRDRNGGSIHVYSLVDALADPLVLATDFAASGDLVFDSATPERLAAVDNSNGAAVRWVLAEQSEFATTRSLVNAPDTELQALSLDGAWLAAVTEANQVFLSNVAGGASVSGTVGANVVALAVNASGRQVAVASCAPGSVGGPPPASAPDKPGNEDETPVPPTNRGEDVCKLEIWSATPGQPITRTYGITVSAPISALAFHPVDAGLLAMGDKSGEIQTVRFPSGQVTGPFGDPIPDLTDLSFSADGERLAALSTRGHVQVWTWPEGAPIHESEAGDGEDKGARFARITLLDDWLAVAADVATDMATDVATDMATDTPSKIKLLTLGRAEPVGTPLALDSGSVGDLVFNADQQTLSAVQPERIVQWPMDQERWLELACTRAGRNLGYPEWLRAFPDEKSYEETAFICPGPLDVSFAEEEIKEAAKALNNCTASQWDVGLRLLEDAKGLPVEPAIDIDPLAMAVDILSTRALELLQRQGSYDEEAADCLQLVADKLVQAQRPGFAVDAALEVGRRHAALVAGLAESRFTDTAELLQTAAWIDQRRSQWPGVIPVSLVAPGQEISGQLIPGENPTYFFVGTKGQVANVDMNATGRDLDLGLSVHGPQGDISSSSGYGDRVDLAIQQVVLPEDGIYRILPVVYSGSGDFRLSLTAQLAPELALDQETPVAAGGRSMWLFQGERGQVVAVDLAMAESLDDVYLTAERLDRSWSAYGRPSGAGQRIAPTPLPADDLYAVRVDIEDSTTPYTLTLRQVEPLALDLGETQQSTLDANDIWEFSGQAGRIISATLLVTDTLAQPTLELLDERGVVLASHTSDLAAGVAAITGLILPDDGPIFVRPSGFGDRTPYRLRVGEVTPAELRPDDEAIFSTTSDANFWAFTGRPGQVVQISLNAAEGADLDTLVRLIGAKGEPIDSNDDGGPGYDSLLTVVAPSSAPLLVQADRYRGVGGFTLAAVELPVEPLPLNGAAVDLVADRAWTLEGASGQVLTIEIDDGGDDGYASVRLFTADGRRVGSSDGRASFDAVLPRSGTYIVTPQVDVDFASGDTFKATLIDAAEAQDLNDAASQTLFSLAASGSIDEAQALYGWGTTAGAVQFTPDARMALCWHSALRGAAQAVIEVCEELPDPSETTDPDVLALRREVRGVARALTGRIEGAIADFEYYVGQNGSYAAQRRDWIERLRAGEPVSEVLDAATLRDLLLQ